jgi:NAD(P)-dependent dehydrogenase (short-subunit alcohol dehydrogenase family)
MTKTWMITGSSRGFGRRLAEAVLEAGDNLVATARSTGSLKDLAENNGGRFRAVPLDVTDPGAARAAAETAVREFGRLDVLVNNAGYANVAPIEDADPDDFRAQVETNLFGPLNVTRAVLPVMRAQRSGLVVTISSTAGITGGEFTSAYAAAKFALEGWMESLAPEVAPYGIRTMLVVPGFFRTDLLTPESTSYAEPSIDDYTERTKQTVAAWSSMDGRQGGDPAKLAKALIQLVGSDEPPLRWAAGADAVGALEQKARTLLEQADAHRELSSSLAHDE